MKNVFCIILAFVWYMLWGSFPACCAKLDFPSSSVCVVILYTITIILVLCHFFLSEIFQTIPCKCFPLSVIKEILLVIRPRARFETNFVSPSKQHLKPSRSLWSQKTSITKNRGNSLYLKNIKKCSLPA